jgi:hypothetical protein
MTAELGRTIASAAVALLVALYWRPVLPLGLNLYDEGIRLYGADRVLAGDLPYFDFFAYYGPAQFYWPAALFELFGREIMVARIGGLAVAALAAASVFAVCRRAGLGWPWAAVPVVALVTPIHRGEHLIICDPAFALVLASGAWLTGAWTRNPSPFVGGLLLGLAALFRHDFGAYGAVAGVATLGWERWQAVSALRQRASPSGPSRMRETVRSLGALLAGIATVAVPIYGAFAFRGPRHLFVALVEAPPELMRYRTLPYLYELRRGYWAVLAEGWSSEGVLSATRLAVLLSPLVTLVLLASLLVPAVRRGQAASERTTVLVFLLAAAAGTTVYALGRSDPWHVYPLHVMSACVASIVAGGLFAAHGPPSWRRAGSALLVSILGLALVLVATAQGTRVAAARRLDSPRATGIVVPRDLTWVSTAVSDITRGGPGPIFVAAERHDRVHTNAAVLYFLSGRPSGTYYHDFIPGVTTTRVVQERIVQDLERHLVRTVVIWKTRLPDEPNPSHGSSGVRTLDQYLAARFGLRRQEEHYDLLRR